MKVRDEIEKYAAEDDKPILRWLFERNHMESQWSYVATFLWAGKSPESYHVWKPRETGRSMYECAQMRELLKDAPCECTGVDGLGNTYHDENNAACFKSRAAVFLKEIK